MRLQSEEGCTLDGCQIKARKLIIVDSAEKNSRQWIRGHVQLESWLELTNSRVVEFRGWLKKEDKTALLDEGSGGVLRVLKAEMRPKDDGSQAR